VNFYEDFQLKAHPTGSNYICNPPVTNTDIDTVVLCKEGYEESLAALGWEPYTDEEGNETYCNNGDFKSWRKGNKNYIVTCDPTFYKKFVIATKAAKGLNLTSKPQRIYFFEAVFFADQYIEPATFDFLEVPF
jgi:hypothetical protein